MMKIRMTAVIFFMLQLTALASASDLGGFPLRSTDFVPSPLPEKLFALSVSWQTQEQSTWNGTGSTASRRFVMAPEVSGQAVWGPVGIDVGGALVRSTPLDMETATSGEHTLNQHGFVGARAPLWRGQTWVLSFFGRIVHLSARIVRASPTGVFPQQVFTNNYLGLVFAKAFSPAFALLIDARLSNPLGLTGGSIINFQSGTGAVSLSSNLQALWGLPIGIDLSLRGWSDWYGVETSGGPMGFGGSLTYFASKDFDIAFGGRRGFQAGYTPVFSLVTTKRF